MAKVNPYGGSDWGGLFEAQGNTLSDVRAKIGQEREAKVRQAYADVISGGGSIAAGRQAKAIEQQNQLFQGIAQNLFGSEDGMISQDPRLAKAVKRDKDRKEVVSILGTYTDPNSPGGSEISEQEMKQGFSELMKRGYVKEAKEFLAMAQSMGGQRRADVTSGLDQQKFNWKKIVDDKTLTQGDKKLRLNALQTNHNIKIDYEKLGVSKDDLKLQGDIAFAKIAWDKQKNNRAQGEIERSNLARESLTSRGYDINEDGNVIKREQLTETERMNTARIGNMEKDIKLRSRVQDFNEDFKNRSFGWQKKMDELNADLKKQGLEIRREGNNIQLVGIETRADTEDKNRSAQLTQTRERILSSENINRYNELGKNKRAELDRELRKSLDAAKTLRDTKTIKAPDKDERLAVLNFVKTIKGVKDSKTNKTGPNLQNSLQEFYEGGDWGSIDSESIGTLSSHAKKIMESHRRRGIPLEITDAVKMIVDANLGAGKFDFKRGSGPQITIKKVSGP